MENLKKNPHKLALEARQRRKTTNSNKRHCTKGSSSKTNQIQPITPLSNITPTSSFTNISSHPSTISPNYPSIETSSISQNVIISHNRTKQTTNGYSIPNNHTVSSSSQSQVGTKRKTPHSNNQDDIHSRCFNNQVGRLNNSIHTQPSDINNSNQTPIRQRHYQTRGVNLYNKFTATITPNDPSTSNPQNIINTKSQYSHIFDNHCIESSSSDSDAGSLSSSYSEEESETDSDIDVQDEDHNDDEEEDQGQFKITYVFIKNMFLLLITL
jgi:hypothetical protein